MKNKRLRNYLQQKTDRKAILKTGDTQNNPEKHTNQDFIGYPHAPAKKEIINPKTKLEKKTAALESKDGEKIIYPQSKKKNKLSAIETEQKSDGSANAFEATERVQDAE